MFEKIMDILGHEAVMNFILGIFGLVITWILKSELVEKYNLTRAALAIKSGVIETYHYLVKGLKAASADGTLTEDEKEEARKDAYNRATQIFKEKGKDLAKYYGPRAAASLIERYVNQAKNESKYENKKAGIAKVLLPFLFLPLLAGCFGKEPPKEVKDAQRIRTAALDSYSKNTKTILAEIIKDIFIGVLSYPNNR